MRIATSACVFLMLLGSSAYPWTETLTIAYDEPTTDVNGNTFNNLTETLIKVWMITRTGKRVAHPDISIPASSPNGGGSIQQEIVVGPIDDYHWIQIRAIATANDDRSLDSKASNYALHRIDRVPPMRPK